MISDDEMRKMWKKAIMAYFKALSQHVTEGTMKET
jgi:hypothetical protein